MKNKKGLINKTILIVALLTISIFFVLTYTRKKKRENNLYKLATVEEKSITLPARGIFIFNEDLLGLSNEVGVSDIEIKLLRNKDIIDNKSNLIPREIKGKYASNSIDLEHSLSEITSNIYRSNLYKIPLTSLDSINQVNKFQLDNDGDEKVDIIEAQKSGYLVNFTDGYEEILNIEDFDEIFSDKLFYNKEIRLNFRQKKFVDNKLYYLLTKIDNFDDYNNIKFQNISITFKDSNKSFQSKDYKVIRDSFGNPYLLFTLNEGLEEALVNRIKNLDIELRKLNLIKIPSKALVKNNNSTGVYFLSDNRVDFARVNPVYKNNNYTYVLFKKEDNYNKAFLDKLDANNKAINYKMDHPNYIRISELKEFSSIILDPHDLKVGDSY